MRELPASVGQRLLWMMHHYRPEFGALNCPLLCRLRGPLDMSALEGTLTELTRRHESLRTTFAGRGPHLTQRVHQPCTLEVRPVDVASEGLAEAIATELQRPIDVQEWPTRVTLWRVAPEEHVLCLNMHHLVTDAWSCANLFRELHALYGGGRLPPPAWQYADFVAWQARFLEGDGPARHRDYWRRRLAGAELAALPRTTREPAPGVARGDLAPAVVDELRELVRRERTTLFAALLAVFYVQLHRLTEQRDLVVASLFANRAQPELRDTVGFVANMVLLRTQIDDRATFSALLREVHATVIGAFLHQELPYQMLPLDTVERRGGRADDVVFQVMADPEYRRFAGGAELELLVPETIGSRFPLELALAPLGRRYRAVLFYTSDRLDPARATELVRGYVAVATSVAVAPDAPLAEVAAAAPAPA